MISINDYTVFRRAGTAFCARRPAETVGTKSRAHPAMMVHFFMEITLYLKTSDQTAFKAQEMPLFFNYGKHEKTVFGILMF
ncbi:MAG: hypothetical protein AB7S75_17575 [Desulfococcaceae bacterium]